MQRSDGEVLQSPATERAQRSVLRYALLAALTFLLAVPAGYIVSTRLHASYTAEGRLWLEPGARASRPDGLLKRVDSAPDAGAWIELLRSYAVLGPVVRDGVQFAENDVALSSRGAARELSQRLTASVDPDGGIIRVALVGTDPLETTRVLNAVMQHTVDIAARLKQARLDQQVSILEKQLDQAQRDLIQAERDLEETQAEASKASSKRPSAPEEERLAEARLRTRVQTMASICGDLTRLVERAKLAAASSTPDLRILERASVPTRRRHGLH